MGWVAKGKSHFFCEACRGFGYSSCSMDDVRREYKHLRSIVSEGRGLSPHDVDKLVEKRVERLKFVTGRDEPEVWFTVLFFFAKGFGLEEEWFDKPPKK